MANELKFVTLTGTETIPLAGTNLVVLGYDNWDDWFEFETTYNVFLFGPDGRRFHLGGIKIGQEGQKERRAALPREFTQLPPNFFSVGLSEDYYKTLFDLGYSDQILTALNDLAADLTIYERYKHERVASVCCTRLLSLPVSPHQFFRGICKTYTSRAYSGKIAKLAGIMNG